LKDEEVRAGAAFVARVNSAESASVYLISGP
jgi:hypothetical protein